MPEVEIDPTAVQISTLIAMGKYDPWIDDLVRALQDRKVILNHRQLRKWHIGDQAVLQNLPMGGKYLNGIPVVVRDIKLKRLVVEITKEGVLFRGRSRRLIVYPEWLATKDQADG